MIESPLLINMLGYIDGSWCSADSGKTQSVVNPATGQAIAQVPAMGREETRRAIESAAHSLKQPASLKQRSAWLLHIAELIQQNREELGRIITHEHGKPWKEAQGEADYAASFFRYYADNVQHLGPQQLSQTPHGYTWTVHHRPAGVAALITPWNFPLAMLAKKFSAALAAGCGTVIKPSSRTPLTLIALFRLLEQVGLPSGKANLILGPASEISDVLCAHPAVRIISFTGSTSVGKKLAAATAPHLKRLSLELGGNAPFIVFEDADVGQAVEHLMSNKFRGAGQTCVCANRVYVHRNLADAFSQKLGVRTRQLQVGNGMDAGVEMGPLIDKDAFEKVHQHVADALAQGATQIATQDSANFPRDGHFFPPTVLRGVTPTMQCVAQETFGPLVPIIEFDDEAEVIAAANSTEFGLAAYVFTADSARAERVISQLSFGHVGWNTGAGPTAEAPFGGMKHSGYGREGGLEGLHEFTELQTVPGP